MLIYLEIYLKKMYFCPYNRAKKLKFIHRGSLLLSCKKNTAFLPLPDESLVSFFFLGREPVKGFQVNE